MSRHSSSTKAKSSHRGMDSVSEDALEQCKSVVNYLNGFNASLSHELDSYLVSARSAMTALDKIRFFREPHRCTEQVWLLNGLQDFAFHDPDSGVIHDIADWSRTGWLSVLRNYPENVEALTGLGYNWSQRSQEAVARIAREESNDSSSQGSSNTSASPPADPRRQGPLYVEAQGYLQPAAEFYTRAVTSADRQGTTSGGLLASAGDAYISLAHVSAPPNDVRNFDRAVQYLRRAEGISGYYLSSSLQQFLDSYGRYVR